MANLWYLVQGDDDLGPMTTDELKRLAADGKIGPRALVRKRERVGGSWPRRLADCCPRRPKADRAFSTGARRWRPALTAPSSPRLRATSTARHPRPSRTSTCGNRLDGGAPLPGCGWSPGRHC